MALPGSVRRNLTNHFLWSLARNRRRCCLLGARNMSESLTPEDAGRRATEVALRSLNATASQERIRLGSLLAHAGVGDLSNENAPMAPPLHMSTTYTRPADGMYLPTDSIYGREDNPTRRLLEDEIAKLECHNRDDENDETQPPTSSAISCAFASGMMAVSSIILAHEAPLHVILHNDVYMGVPTVLLDVFSRFHVSSQRVALTNESLVRQALANIPEKVKNVILWMESPSNPQCHVLDLTKLCQLVAEQQTIDQTRRFTTVVDSTLAPPPISQPLLLGVDIVMHSATKYLAGHSDATIGVATTSPYTDRGIESGPKLRQVQRQVGGIASPMDSWLTLRGLRTLELRACRQSDSALYMAQHLQKKQHPLVTAVHYPGLESHPQHNIAKRQMKSGSFGGVLSFELLTIQHAMAMAGALTTIRRATSLGGTETLVEHRASIEPPGRNVSPPGLLRMSVGLEDIGDLIRDVDNALRIAQNVVTSGKV